MAGRYVLLEFDSLDLANAFLFQDKALEQDGARVTGVFMKPDKFCECADRKRMDGKNWVKGKRTGMYLCVTCKKPSMHHQGGILARLQYVFGFNLRDNS